MIKRVLMCEPTHFDIEYEINTWMDKDNQVNQEAANRQWQELKKTYEQLGFEVETIKPEAGLPDMVFTANGALVIGGKVMLPRFKFKERQPETELFGDWFRQHGYTDVMMPEHDFEGEGDALVFGDLIFAGWGFRSDQRSHAELDRFFDETVISLHLVDDRFYHLDTAMAIIDTDTVAYYPGAFDANSRKALEQAVPILIPVAEKDAEAFGLNAVSDGMNVVLSDRARGLIKQIEDTGRRVYPADISEFQKSGGGAKCLTLELR